MLAMIPLDGAQGEGGGQILRSALTLSAATLQPFHLTSVRSGRVRPGLRPQHLAAVRAVALASGAKLNSDFEGSQELKFAPAQVSPGDFRFEIGTAGSTGLVLQTVLPVLARADAESRVAVTGGTHVSSAPPFEFVARHWAGAVAACGLELEARLLRAGFFPKGGGEVRAKVGPMRPVAGPLDWTTRGPLVGVKGYAGTGRQKSDLAHRMRDAATSVLWEEQRLEPVWEISADARSESPGAWVMLEAVFEKGRGAFGVLFDRRSRPEVVGARAARSLLRFLEREEAVDSHLADQLAVPMALARGGELTTPELTMHLSTVAEVLKAFGFRARLDGRIGGPGTFAVEVV